MGEVKVAFVSFALIYLIAAIGLIVAGFVKMVKFRRREAPLIKLADMGRGWFIGATLGLLVTLMIGWYRYVAPINLQDLVANRSEFAGKNFAIKGTVKNVTPLPEHGLAMYYIDESAFIHVETRAAFPKDGQKVWVFGRGHAIEGTIALEEYFRF